MNNPFGLFLFFFVCIIPVLFFLQNQQRTLEAIRFENRGMSPAKVWLQLIPIFGLIWQFFVIDRIADSIRDELNTPLNDSAAAPVQSDVRPTFSVGIAYAICFCVSALPIPIIKWTAIVVGLLLWLSYWSELAKYKKAFLRNYTQTNP